MQHKASICYCLRKDGSWCCSVCFLTDPRSMPDKRCMAIHWYKISLTSMKLCRGWQSMDHGMDPTRRVILSSLQSWGALAVFLRWWGFSSISEVGSGDYGSSSVSSDSSAGLIGSTPCCELSSIKIVSTAKCP